MARFGIYPASFNGGAFLLNHLGSVRANGGAQKLMARAGGALTRAHVSTAFADPRITFKSFDLAAVLGNISLVTGAAITSSSLIQYQQRQDQAAFQSGSNHVHLAMTKGFIHPTSIDAQQDDTTPATVELEVICQYDGTNVPLRILTGQALSGSPSVTDVMYLAKVVLEGVTLTGNQSTSIRPGLTYEVLRSDGDVWAREGSRTLVEPQIRIAGTYVDGLASLGFNGSAASTGLTVYFRRGVHGGARVADNLSQHVSVSMAAGDYDLQEVPVEGTGDAQPVLVCRPTGNLAFNTATTIP